MTTKNIELVKNSWALVAAMDMETIGSLFYARLFEIAPNVKSMFSKTAMPEQSKKLLTMLSYVIAKLDKLEDIINEVKKLAQRHEGYGVKVAHYMAVRSALLWTLEQGLRTHWDDELKEAWIEVYTVLSEAMMNSAKAAA